MDAARGHITVATDSSPARPAGTATEILAAALSELLREAKRHTALLETLVQRPAEASRTVTAAGPADAQRKPAAASAAPPPSTASSKSHSGTRGGTSSTACFSVEELRARARAHNHLLDVESPKSRAILALLQDDGTVPVHFPADIADFMALTSSQLHSLLRAYGQPDSNGPLVGQRAVFGRFIGLHKYCKG